MNSKSLTILLFVFLVNCHAAKSQNKEFVVGAMLGFYGIHIVGDIEEMYSPTNGNISGTGGLSFGFNVKHNFTKNIYGAFELRYIRKGSIYTFITSYGTKAFESIRLNYFEIPFLLGFKINLKKNYLLTETGIAYARIFSSSMSVSDLNQWDYSDKLNNFKRNEYSWIANVKYPIVKSEKLLVGFRFSCSLSTIHSYYKLRNLIYGIELYYFFNRKVK